MAREDGVVSIEAALANVIRTMAETLGRTPPSEAALLESASSLLKDEPWLAEAMANISRHMDAFDVLLDVVWAMESVAAKRERVH